MCNYLVSQIFFEIFSKKEKLGKLIDKTHFPYYVLAIKICGSKIVYFSLC